MSTEAVSEDIFSILQKFLTPTMTGQFPNTNAPRPMPPAGSDAARALSDPSRYPGSPQGGGPAPGRPQPVARRVVADPEATGSLGGPGGGRPPAAIPGAPAPVPGAPAATPANPLATTADAGGSQAGDAAFLNDPAANYYRVWREQQNRRRAQELKDQSIGDIAGGLMGLGGALTGTDVDVSGTGSGRREKLTSADLDIDHFRQLQGDVKAAHLLIQKQKNMAIFADRYGIPIEDLNLLSEADLSRISFNKNDDKAVAEAVRAAIEAKKAGQGLIDPRLQSDETLRIIAKELNLANPSDPAVIESLRRMSPEALQDMRIKVATSAATTAQPRLWEGKEIEEAQKQRLNLNTQSTTLPQLEYLVDQLDAGMRSGGMAPDALNSLYRNIGGLIGRTYDPATENTDQYNAAVQSLVRQAIKSYGANPSNTDREAAEKAFGAGATPEVARAQLALVAKAQIWEIQKHNANIQDRIDNTGMSEGNKAALAAQKVRLPPPTAETLHVMGIEPQEVELLRSKIGTPQEKEARSYFRQQHGAQIAEWALGEAK